ncbi:MAG: hypothetical protein U0L51_02015, partial [Olegusella sp.]|nr:hypothetical protein [Olegusella sp.]
QSRPNAAKSPPEGGGAGIRREFCCKALGLQQNQGRVPARAGRRQTAADGGGRAGRRQARAGGGKQTIGRKAAG